MTALSSLFSVRIVHASGMLHKPAYGSYNNCVYVSVYFCGQLLTNVAMFHQNRRNRTSDDNKTRSEIPYLMIPVN
jgi:predicted NUDIX family phosphoesterase